jgi:hypothetical protein
MAMAARDLGFVETVLISSDMGLRRAALRAVRTLPVRDQAIAGAFDDAPTELRQALYRALAHGRRHALADALLPEVHSRWGDRDAAALLPACGGPAVSRWLPKLAHAVTSWTALGERHPQEVLAVADLELAAGCRSWDWWRRRGAGVAVAALTEPVRVLSLLERHHLHDQAARLPSRSLAALLRADPTRAMRLLADRPSWGWGGSAAVVLAHLRLCSDEEILAAAPAHARGLAALLWSLPPGRRAAIFDEVVDRNGGLAELSALPLLELLPAERAAAEARRMLEWYDSVWHSSRSRLDDPNIPLKLTSHLPYEEAAGPLREAATGGDTRRRGLGRRLLVRCAARTGDAAVFGALLTDLTGRTTNEQDPLRADLLNALCEVAPGLFGDSCAEALEQLVTHAINVRDSSPGTREAVRRLAGRILRHHDPAAAPALTTWALGAYEKLVARYGADGLGSPDPGAQAFVPRGRRRGRASARRKEQREDSRLDLTLRRGQEHDLLALLRPHLSAARSRGDFTLAVALARALGRRSEALAELQEDLRAAVLTAPEPIARQAADLWLAAASEREERVAGLLAEDPSAVALPAVWRFVATRRTDLMLTSPAGRGRFDVASWVPQIDAGMAGRWTPAQREHVRALLTAVVEDDQTPIGTRAAAVQGMGRISGGRDRLAEWARREETVLAEAALEALGGADAPADALPLLLEHARGQASPVAVAALSRCAGGVPPSRLGVLLGRALLDPGAKVTVRKQAARQLARHQPMGAADLLLRAWADDGLHRDVRVAVAAALLRMPEDPRTLDALGDAAGRHAGELMARTLFQANPLEYAPAVRHGYADLIRWLLIAADDPGVRHRGSKAFAAWAGWYRGGFDDLVAAVSDPRSDEGERMLPVFLTLLETGVIGVETLDVLARLTAVSPGGEAGLSLTQARDRVSAIADGLASAPLYEPGSPPWRREVADRAVGLLAARPLLLPQAARIAMAALPVPTGANDDGGPEALADGLCALADLLRDRPVLAARTAGRPMSFRFDRYAGARAVEPAVLLPSVRRLADRGHIAAGLFAVTLIRIAGSQTSWAPEWRAALDDLRDSPLTEVRQEAWDTEIT